ncbi:hypothetical protein AAFF_G00357110 [Aldrovandia affinis]|uniref:PDZ domain-containing protein n=1 Tax=Aldrovandia affinis TaxID=143900 RepID=A0AAD7T941_9TELE|nr:hypothetical protein AAFF_G00357110 [Aldrovandia affinis]
MSPFEEQVDEGGRAAQVGLCEGDEVVSLNGQSCADLTLQDAMALMHSAADSLRLLVKRYKASDPLGLDADQASFGGREPVKGDLQSTTLEIWPPRELYISESQDEACCGGKERDTELLGGASLGPARRANSVEAPCRGGPQGLFPPGGLVELQLSLSQHTLEERSGGDVPGGAPAALPTESGCAREPSSGDTTAATVTSTKSLYIPRCSREPLAQRGEVEVTLQCFGRSWQREEKEEVGAEARGSGCADPQGEGGHSSRAPPACVSFGIFTEGAEPAEQWDSGSEGDISKPNKHHARHARLRRSESQSEKQVKEAKSKCKRIALLLTAAPNQNNKGVLMFKRHRQRAKKYTLVSYGTGENEPEEEDDEEEEEGTFTFLATSESELDEEFLANAQSHGHIVTLDWDTGLLEIEKRLDNGEDMECLPDTKGKGALMFAQRRQRMDEIAAEHEEMRSKGIPVEGVQAADIPQITKHTSYQPRHLGLLNLKILTKHPPNLHKLKLLLLL